ncbi:hypothetical protein FPSM_01693 [Flavobacterium psychrophilum]|nr:hypothetical protein FPSM_01693 [Flavobacterium psychrophilum]
MYRITFSSRKDWSSDKFILATNDRDFYWLLQIFKGHLFFSLPKKRL